MLFKNYPQITYRIGNKDITLVDIFKNISFTNVDNNNAFDDYYIQDGETPEHVSLKFYGTTSYGWLVLLVNGLLDIKKDWFVSASEFNATTETTLGGDAIYIPSLPDVQPGDVVVKVLTQTGGFADTVNINAYRHVADFDPYFRKIRGICGGGTFAAGDSVVIARKQSNGSVVPLTFDNTDLVPALTDIAEVLYVEKYTNSVEYFITGNDVVLNPYMNVAYAGGTSISSLTTYSDAAAVSYTDDNYADTLIYYYSENNGSLPANISKFAVGTDNYNKYIKKQKIRILKSELLSTVVGAIQSALNGDNVGKIFKVEL